MGCTDVPTDRQTDVRTDRQTERGEGGGMSDMSPSEHHLSSVILVQCSGALQHSVGGDEHTDVGTNKEVIQNTKVVLEYWNFGGTSGRKRYSPNKFSALRCGF